MEGGTGGIGGNILQPGRRGVRDPVGRRRELPDPASRRRCPWRDRHASGPTPDQGTRARRRCPAVQRLRGRCVNRREGLRTPRRSCVRRAGIVCCRRQPGDAAPPRDWAGPHREPLGRVSGRRRNDAARGAWGAACRHLGGSVRHGHLPAGGIGRRFRRVVGFRRRAPVDRRLEARGSGCPDRQPAGQRARSAAPDERPPATATGRSRDPGDGWLARTLLRG
jgi:hypothetical protein